MVIYTDRFGPVLFARIYSNTGGFRENFIWLSGISMVENTNSCDYFKQILFYAIFNAWVCLWNINASDHDQGHKDKYRKIL